MLVEAGWCYRLPAREERRYRERVANLPEDVDFCPGGALAVAGGDEIMAPIPELA